MLLGPRSRCESTPTGCQVRADPFTADLLAGLAYCATILPLILQVVRRIHAVEGSRSYCSRARALRSPARMGPSQNPAHLWGCRMAKDECPDAIDKPTPCRPRLLHPSSDPPTTDNDTTSATSAAC